jgi:hypothetical protein
MGKKGVSIVFEQVLLFMIGLTIFIACFSMFRSYELYFSESITANQFEEVGEWIASKIVGFSERADINSTVRISIPKLLGNEYYEINLTQRGLKITGFLSGRSVFLPLSGINQSFSLSGGFSTAHGSEFVIYKKGNQIIIG